MKGTLDRFHREINEEFARLQDTDAKFGFLIYVEGLCYVVVTNSNDLMKKCSIFCVLYCFNIDDR